MLIAWLHQRQHKFRANISLLRSVTFLAPGKKEEVLARVKRRIGSPNEARAESALVHGHVALDLLTRIFTATGVRPDLTAREFTMLEFFFVTLGK